jgi:hypothetical protein
MINRSYVQKKEKTRDSLPNELIFIIIFPLNQVLKEGIRHNAETEYESRYIPQDSKAHQSQRSTAVISKKNIEQNTPFFLKK